MMTPVEISFHGIEKSEAVEADIRKRMKRIEAHFERLTHARVVVESPQRKGSRPRFFEVRIELGIPGKAPIVITQSNDPERTHTDVTTAVRDAFSVAMRRVDEHADRIDKPARRERVRRRPKPPETEA